MHQPDSRTSDNFIMGKLACVDLLQSNQSAFVKHLHLS